MKDDRYIRDPVPIAKTIVISRVVAVAYNNQKLESELAFHFRNNICIDRTAVRNEISVERNDFWPVRR